VSWILPGFLVNQAIEATGMMQMQRMSTLFDGISRHSPEGWHLRLGLKPLDGSRPLTSGIVAVLTGAGTSPFKLIVFNRISW